MTTIRNENGGGTIFNIVIKKFDKRHQKHMKQKKK